MCLARARASINKDAVEERNAGEVAIDDGAFLGFWRWKAFLGLFQIMIILLVVNLKQRQIKMLKSA